MTAERKCPHCGNLVGADLNICPHCRRTLPAAWVDATQGQWPPATSSPGPEQVSPSQPPPSAPRPYYVPPATPGPVPPAPRPDDSLGIVGLVLSIIGVASCGCLAILSPIGLILSVIAHTRRQTGVTLAGLIIGALGTLLFVVSTIFSLYYVTHQAEVIEQVFRGMGIPLPPNFPSP